jgi:hypothetical protein
LKVIYAVALIEISQLFVVVEVAGVVVVPAPSKESRRDNNRLLLPQRC